jgi:ferrous iron transport protein A
LIIFLLFCYLWLIFEEEIAMLKSLADIPVGSECRISRLSAEGLLRRRLLDLGFVPGTKVECLRRSPAGDPTAYLIRGTIIALREEDATHIQILEPGGNGK